MVYGVGSGTDHLHQCRRDSGVEPRRDTLVDLQPLSIVSHGASIDRAINVVDDAELVKSGVEEGAPGRERGVAVVKLNRDMQANVDMLYGSDGESGGRRVSKGVLGAGDRRGGAGGHGCLRERSSGGDGWIVRKLIPYRECTALYSLISKVFIQVHQSVVELPTLALKNGSWRASWREAAPGI
jgi:hypothetical protein